MNGQNLVFTSVLMFVFQTPPSLFSQPFSGGPGLAGTRMSQFWILLEPRMMEVVVTTGATRRAKLQSNCHHQQTNIQLFYRPDALPVTQPTVSKQWTQSTYSTHHLHYSTHWRCHALLFKPNRWLSMTFYQVPHRSTAVAAVGLW